MADDATATVQIYNIFEKLLDDLSHKKFKNFKDIIQKVKELNLNTEDILIGVTNIVFEKVTKDIPIKATGYAKLCTHMFFHILEHNTPVQSEPENYEKTPAKIFRKLLINHTQKEFMSYANCEVNETILKLESELATCTEDRTRKIIKVTLAEEEAKVKMNGRAICNFISVLYSEQLVTGKIMVFCMNQLIDKNQDEKLECVCRLLKSCGRQLNYEAGIRNQIDVILDRLQDISDQSKKGTIVISRSASFAIQNILKSMRQPKAKVVKPTKKLVKKESNKKLAEVLREIKNGVSHLMENAAEGTENHHALIGLHNKCEEGLQIIKDINNPATFRQLQNQGNQEVSNKKREKKYQAHNGDGDINL